jgi:8-oxo-dGTP diphosphatase
VSPVRKFGVSQKVVIFYKGKFLAIRRTSTAPANPNMWDLPGGDLNFGERAASGIVREAKEETGLVIHDVTPYDVESHVNDDGDFWVTIAYMAKSSTDKVVLSYEHDQFRWVTKDEFMRLRSAEKLRQFVRNLR